VIKLPDDTTEVARLVLLGLLNSSTACFWMKQSFQTRGSSGIGRGIYDERWEFFYEFTGTGLGAFPVVDSRADALDLAKELNILAREVAELSPSELADSEAPKREALDGGRKRTEYAQARMVAVQEELDWLVYRLYGLVDEDDRSLEWPMSEGHPP